MSYSKIKFKIPFCIAFFLFFFTTAGDGPQLLAEDGKARSETACNIHETACIKTLPDGTVTLDINPKPVRAMADLGFTVILTGKKPSAPPFIDLGMPGISGWEVASRIKASDKSIPVIVMTGWGAQVEEAKVKGTGVQKVLAKPMQMRQVVAVTEETLRRARDK